MPGASTSDSLMRKEEPSQLEELADFMEQVREYAFFYFSLNFLHTLRCFGRFFSFGCLE